MNTEIRRKKIIERLESSPGAVSANILASEFKVSRQIIVGDIALLRAGGIGIEATPRGYMLSKQNTNTKIYTIACIHTMDKLRDELYVMVDNGCEVIDVVVEHAVYGQITGMLKLSNRYNVDQFVKKLETSTASPLSTLTDGIHIHNLHCSDDETYERVRAQLKDLGILFEAQ